jgi:Ni,Fe-hydrogenase maturation factor
MGHTSDPRWLLALTEAAYGRRPEAWLVTIPAADFALGGRLSGTAQAGMAVAMRQINRLVCARNLELRAVANA